MTPTTCTTSTTATSSVMAITRAEALSSECLGLENLAKTLSTHQAIESASLENRCQLRIGGLPEEMTHPIFMQCLANGDIKGFLKLGFTSTYSYSTTQYLVNKLALTQLCRNLRILNAKTYTFQADLEGIDKYNTLQSYDKLEPFVENREGLTILFNYGGLTFKDMKNNPCKIAIELIGERVSEALDNVPEKDAGAVMVSNAPITETRNKDPEAQETRVRDKVGFDGKPTLIQSLVLLLATQEKLGICLYKESPLYLESPNMNYGRTSTLVGAYFVVVGDCTPERIVVHDRSWDDNDFAAGGRKKLKA